MHALRTFFNAPKLGACTLLIAALSGCGGGDLDPVLGTPDITRVPTVTATSPVASTPIVTGVDIRTKVTAIFSKPMKAASLTPASFSLGCPGSTAVTATVSYDVATRIATLTPAAPLPPTTICTATISTGVMDMTDVPLSAAFVWSFVTGPAAALDTTRPTVTVTLPLAGATEVPINTKISATFSEPMNPATLTAASFSVTNTTAGAAVAGTVTYVAASRTATFTPALAASLASGSLYTATISMAATDLAGNALAGNTASLPAAGNQVWTFTTGASTDSIAPEVIAISPVDADTAVCSATASVSATFSEDMDAATITTSSFSVTDGGVAAAGSVSYNALTRVATFAPTAATGLPADRGYVVTIAAGSAGVKDLAGNALATARIWAFSTGVTSCGTLVTTVDLGSAASFGAFGGAAGVTNQGINTVVGGNLGSTAACSLITGFHDASNVYTQTPLNIGAVNGSINCGPPAPGTSTTLAIAVQARADAQAAYNLMAALPPGTDPGAGQLGGLVLAPGVYTSAGGTFDVTSGDLTLDAKGNANAAWVFQSASALTVGLQATPRRVVLINGAQAKNVFWQVGSAARVEDGSTMVGTIIAPAGVTFSTAGQAIQTTLVGRAIGLTASVTLVNTTIVAP